MKEEFCIMPESDMYKTERFSNSARHEIFFGNGNRKLSIKHGLVVFLTHDMHNMSDKGVHFNHVFDLWLKKKGQKAAMEYYGWSIEDFRREFGKNYL